MHSTRALPTPLPQTTREAEPRTKPKSLQKPSLSLNTPLPSSLKEFRDDPLGVLAVCSVSGEQRLFSCLLVYGREFGRWLGEVLPMGVSRFT